jgi:tetratricopeptide (TPR) repeat protein
MTDHRSRHCRHAVALALALTSCADTSRDAPQPWQEAGQAAQQAYRAQRMEQAEAGFREALRLADEADSQVGRMNALEGLAAFLAVADDLDAADSLYTILLQMQRRRLEADSLSGMVVVRTLGSLGQINLRRHDVERADSFFSGIMDLDRRGQVDLRAEEPALAYAVQGLGEVLAARGQAAAADSLRQRAVGLRLYAQGFSLYVGLDMAGAEETWRRALAHQDRVLGPEHQDVARTAHALGGVLEFVGRRDDAIQLYRRAARVYRLTGDSPIDEARVLDDLAALLQSRRPAHSDSMRQRASRIRREMES